MTYPGEGSIHTCEEPIFCCCPVQGSVSVCWVHLVHSVVQGLCIRTDLLSGLPSITESGVLKSPTVPVIVACLPSVLLMFALYI